MSRESAPWGATLCGREPELAALQRLWAEHAATAGPSLAVLLGESGLGKTRLVQEFYAWLAATLDRPAADGSTYWPRELGREGHNLRLNPRFEGLELRVETVPPFLWWGLRFPQVVGRNRVIASALETHAPFLVPHFLPVHLRRRERGRAKEIASTASDVAMEVAGTFLTLGVAGLVKTVIEAGFSAKQVWAETKELRALRELNDAAELREREAVSLGETLLHDLAALHADEDRGRLPLVVAIDDAQWSPHDPVAVTFLARLLARAHDETWPVLFLVTCWEAEWNVELEAALAADDAGDESWVRALASPGSPFRGALSGGSEGAASRCAVVSVGRVPDLKELLLSGLPGLADDQVTALLARADGNPQLLEELMFFLRSNPRFFVDKDVARALQPRALEACLRRPFALEDLARERFLVESPEPAREALAIATAQGQATFLPRVAEDVGDSIEVPSVAEGLEAARERALVDLLPDRLGEFRHRSVFEAAVEYLEAAPDDADRAREATTERLVGGATAGDVLEQLTSAERGLLLRLALERLEERDDVDADLDVVVRSRLLEHETSRGDEEEALAQARRLDERVADLGETRLAPATCGVLLGSLSALRRSRTRALTSLLAAVESTHDALAVDGSSEARAAATTLYEKAERVAPEWSGRLGERQARMIEASGEASPVEVARIHLGTAQAWLACAEWDRLEASALAAHERFRRAFDDGDATALAGALHGLLLVGRARDARGEESGEAFDAAEELVSVALPGDGPEALAVERFRFDLAFERGESPRVGHFAVYVNAGNAVAVYGRTQPSNGRYGPWLYSLDERSMRVRRSDGREYVVPDLPEDLASLISRLPALMIVRVTALDAVEEGSKAAGVDLLTPLYNAALHAADMDSGFLSWGRLIGTDGDLLEEE